MLRAAARYDPVVIPSFLAVTVPLVLVPGASTAVVLRNSLTGGARAGIETAVGVNLGTMLYGVLSAFGLALALRQWPSVWMAMRIAGTLYLLWLGLQSIWRALHPAAPKHRERVPGRCEGGPPRSALQNAREGFLTNALNPAIATFYIVVVPQFVPRGAPVVRTMLILSAIHVAIAFTWHVVWAVAGGTLARALSGGRPRRVLDACAGAALVALAIRMGMRS
jgi:threonine/homoserine/homoserine lactone efflux protein